MIEIHLKVKEAVVLLTNGTDLISLVLDAPTPFPEMKYEPSIRIEARANYGLTWCREVLKIEPRVQNVRISYRGRPVQQEVSCAKCMEIVTSDGECECND